MQLIRRLYPDDRLLVALVAASVGWPAVAGLRNGQPMPADSPFFWAPVLLCFGVALGRWSGRMDLSTRAAGVILVISAVLVWVMFSGAGSGSGPLGYANANAAFGVQLAALAALSAAPAAGAARVALVLVGLGALTMPALGSSAGGVAAALILLAGAVPALTGVVGRRWAAALNALVLVGAAASVVWLAARPTLPDVAAAGLDPVRHRLWRDAMALWQQSPVTGSGPGSFARFSPLAVDPDTSTAHSSLLQVGAETGAIGVVLFAALMALGYVVALRASAAQRWITAAAWTALGVHSLFDHLLEFPAITLTAGVILGLAQHSAQLSVSQGERPSNGGGR